MRKLFNDLRATVNTLDVCDSASAELALDDEHPACSLCGLCRVCDGPPIGTLCASCARGDNPDGVRYTAADAAETAESEAR